ncbi:S-layer homology domain-containing protein [Paenibacillus sp. 19GGS1-52]|uniref:S-layer homology domain-containing protein n=1 Tax=Paenibacillus sp. 19GGS1-52 TaxID=2758563 RepID=UPI001EFB1F5B|nr:S-layer homology domain-containing protein [Paenibacillus sp. 19GGS1-52]ULO07668.1 S-layer homology domain-containing protein [Paenibacillus sp. 19GGS1-52]
MGYEQAVAQAVQADIINAYEDRSFRPNAEITRAEMEVMIATALGHSSEANTDLTRAEAVTVLLNGIGIEE